MESDEEQDKKIKKYKFRITKKRYRSKEPLAKSMNTKSLLK